MTTLFTRSAIHFEYLDELLRDVGTSGPRGGLLRDRIVYRTVSLTFSLTVSLYKCQRNGKIRSPNFFIRCINPGAFPALLRDVELYI